MELIILAAMCTWTYVIVTVIDKVLIGEKVMAEVRKDKKDAI